MKWDKDMSHSRHSQYNKVQPKKMSNDPITAAKLLLVLLILCAELLCLLDHAVNFGLRQSPLFVCNSNLVGLSSGLVRGAHVQDAIGIDVVGDLNLWHTTRGWGDAIQVELAQQVVVLGHGSLTLEDLDQHSRLVVRIGREGLSLA